MQELLKELFTAYYKDIYTYLYSLSHDAPLSEDLTSEVFLEVVKSISSFRGKSDIKTWLFAIARHKWFAYLRRKNRQVKLETLSEFYDSQSQSMDEMYQNKALAERVYELLSEEPERTQSIVRMRIDGYSFYEIGIKHGISENSARVIDFRAKTKIRNILHKEGFDSE